MEIVLEEHQICYKVEGLFAPKEGLNLDNYLLIKRKPGRVMIFDENRRMLVPESDDDQIDQPLISPDEAHIYFKIKGSPEKIDKLADETQEELANILHLYVLISNNFVQRLPGRSQKSISNEDPFGSLHPTITLPMRTALRPEQTANYYTLLENTVDFYDKYKKIFNTRSKRYLKNAIAYFYKASEDIKTGHLEMALIDLMISLESLIGGFSELSYRHSLRAGRLVSLIEENGFSIMYKEIYKLYGKRNKIVHGGLEVDLSRKEVNDFRKNIKNIILVLIYIDKNKEGIIDLLDNCIVDYKNANEELNALVTSAKVKLHEKGILKK